MNRADAIAAVLCCTFLAVTLLAMFHHPMPLACWLSAWAVLIFTKERAK